MSSSEREKNVNEIIFGFEKFTKYSSSVSLTLSVERYCCFDIENSAISHTRDQHIRASNSLSAPTNIKAECQLDDEKCCKAWNIQTLSINSAQRELALATKQADIAFDRTYTLLQLHEKSDWAREPSCEIWVLLKWVKQISFNSFFHTTKLSWRQTSKVCITTEPSWARERRALVACVARVLNWNRTREEREIIWSIVCMSSWRSLLTHMAMGDNLNRRRAQQRVHFSHSHIALMTSSTATFYSCHNEIEIYGIFDSFSSSSQSCDTMSSAVISDLCGLWQ